MIISLLNDWMASARGALRRGRYENHGVLLRIFLIGDSLGNESTTEARVDRGKNVKTALPQRE